MTGTQRDIKHRDNCQRGTKKAMSPSQGEKPQKKQTLLTPWSWTSSLQNCERIKFSHDSQSVVFCYGNPSWLIQCPYFKNFFYVAVSRWPEVKYILEWDCECTLGDRPFCLQHEHCSLLFWVWSAAARQWDKVLDPGLLLPLGLRLYLLHWKSGKTRELLSYLDSSLWTERHTGWCACVHVRVHVHVCILNIRHV